MQRATIGEILDRTLQREVTDCRIYLVRDDDIAFYIGQSSTIYDRLESHMGMDWKQEPSILGEHVFAHLPQSREWVVELFSLQDCEQVTVDYMVGKGLFWYTKEIYYERGGVDFAEQAMIVLHHPLLNSTYNY